MQCPCCKQSVDKVDPTALGCFLHMSPQERVIYNELLRNFGQEVPADRIVGVLYKDDPNGGPNSARNVMNQQLVVLRKMVKPYGIDISTGYWGIYVMRWADQQQAAINVAA